MNKIILVLSVLSAFFIGLVSNEVLADESPVTNVSKEEIVLGNAVREYLDTYIDDNGFTQVYITDSIALSSSISQLNGDVTVEQISIAIDAFNKRIVEEKGNGELTNTLKKIVYGNSRRPKRFDACSAVLGTAGLAHTTLYGVAAGALGVAWPVGVGVGAAIGGAYLVGSFFC